MKQPPIFLDDEELAEMRSAIVGQCPHARRRFDELVRWWSLAQWATHLQEQTDRYCTLSLEREDVTVALKEKIAGLEKRVAALTPPPGYPLPY